MIKLVHKKALSLLLSAALVFTMLPVTAFAATGVSYLDSNGDLQTTDATVVDSGSTELSSGWYVVQGDVTIDQTVTVSGDVSLILADGANLTVNASSGDNAGVNVTQGNSLSIYAQSIGSGMGQLTVTGSGNGAGIGSGMFDACGTVSIYGGRITATGGNGGASAAGIGNVSGASYHFGTIGIYGGMITVTNGKSSSMPDIGGNGNNADRIIIQGGTVVSNWSGSQVSLGTYYVGQSIPQIIIDGGSIRVGTLHSDSSGNPLKNSEGDSLSSSPDVLTVPGHANAAVSSVCIGGVPYGNSVYTDGDGNLYLHPPASDSVEPVVVTMGDSGDEYWTVYQPGGGYSALDNTLISAKDHLIYPDEANLFNVMPQDITVYKQDSDSTVFGIKNGNAALTEGTDYTLNGYTVTIKADYLKTLPVGVTTLTLDYGKGDGNPTLAVSVINVTLPDYIALGDSIATGYGLPGRSSEPGATPPGAYVSITGNSLGLSTGNLAEDGLDSQSFLNELNGMPPMRVVLSHAKTITLSIGSDDLLLPFLQIVADNLGCDIDDIQTTLVGLQSDPEALANVLAALNADDGSGLKNNPMLQSAASGFSADFRSVITQIKSLAPDAKIYVTNTYNPYEGIRIGTLNLGAIADGYIKTLNSAFSATSPDYKLIDVYSAFSNSLKNGTSLVNTNVNLDPHPNAAGHAVIANMILTAAGHAPTAGTVSGAIGSLLGGSTPDEVTGVVSQVLALPASVKKQMAVDQVQTLENTMVTASGGNLAPPVVPAPVTGGFSGGSALPAPPAVTGLLLAAGVTGSETQPVTVTLTTTQQPTALGVPGSLVTFDLTLTRQTGSDGPEEVHTSLPFPVTITMRLPGDFAPQANYTYAIVHTKADGTKEILPLVIGGSAGNYTATFTVTSFSAFSLVGTYDGSSSGSHHSSGGSVSGPVAAGGTAAITFVSDTNADFSVNGAYQFKITSKNGTAPSLVIGTPGVFEAKLVSKSGNDYYYKLTVVGKAGGKAGIYVNGVKLLVATAGTAASLVKSDTTVPFKVAPGKTYTFKLTADNAPSFVSGNSSVFQVKFVKQSGREYFYQVTATGKSGQAAGFYINTDKMPVVVAAIA